MTRYRTHKEDHEKIPETKWDPTPQLVDWAEPFTWNNPRRVVISDLFHEAVSSDFVAQVFAVMASTPRHTYRLATEQGDRMHTLLTSPTFEHNVRGVLEAWGREKDCRFLGIARDLKLPLPNAQLGVVVVDQEQANDRVPRLLRTPASLRFVSCQPLGSVDLDQPRCDHHGRDEIAVVTGGERCVECVADGGVGELSFGHWLDPLNGGVGWVIVDGGSLPMHPDWARSLRDQCVIAGVPFSFAWGEWSPDRAGQARVSARRSRFAVEYVHPSGRRYDPVNPPVMDTTWVAMYRKGRRLSGRVLDGRIWDELPAAEAETVGALP